MWIALNKHVYMEPPGKNICLLVSSASRVLSNIFFHSLGAVETSRVCLILHWARCRCNIKKVSAATLGDLVSLLNEPDMKVKGDTAETSSHSESLNVDSHEFEYSPPSEGGHGWQPQLRQRRSFLSNATFASLWLYGSETSSSPVITVESSQGWWGSATQTETLTNMKA